MTDLPQTKNHIAFVSDFQGLISSPFAGEVNAICWKRNFVGDFSEIINKLPHPENINEIDSEDLMELHLNEQGQLARDILLKDLQLLTDHGAAPVLNLIKCYDRDENFPFFPTDVYSFHVDRSPIPSATFLCTYHGASSEIIPNQQVIQKVLVTEIRDELQKLYSGPSDGFEAFLTENYFDLHYQTLPTASPINLGLGNMWKLAIDHPDMMVPPCVHRAPKENEGEYRLLLIC